MQIGRDLGLRGLAVVALCAAAIGLAAFVGVQSFNNGSESLARESGSVQVAGSETMRPVVTACAEDFMARNPEADIIVKGGGSGDGVAALLHGLVDLGMVSRELSRRERDYAEAHGIKLALTGLAMDGVTVIVNPAVGIGSLDMEQLRGIFAGKIRNWREVGGADKEILVFARAPGSGTASLFGERVLGEEPYGASVRRLLTNEAIVTDVAGGAGAIGYADLGASRAAGDRIKAVPLRSDPESAPILPTSDAIRSGQYPLARTLYFGVLGQPSAVAQAFLDHCLGPRGHALVRRAGYVELDPLRP